MVQYFTTQDFATFKIDGLQARMEAIQQNIQPKFQEIGTDLTDHLAARLGNEMHLHIAKHARRSVNPPNDTWLAIADNKRGYKKHPHFQVGLFDSHVFIWLALIYELDGKKDIASAYLNKMDDLKQLPTDFVASLDHMKKDAFPIAQLDQSHLERFRDVKKAEFLIGRHLLADDPRVHDPEQFMSTVKDTFDQLIPFYQLAMHARSL
ncbi:YktB family protein [Lentibacillus saliphilus]|uniref:YktB family protein n=1 Tax=Lentibacillus saliphilus TaxID=2737028 RepID=UPI001C2F7FDD|nr:DUF1054 domain-containing protein [Lentibacillus saliphilus]